MIRESILLPKVRIYVQRRKDGLQGEKREQKGIYDYMAREADGFSYSQTSLEITPYLNLEG